QRRCVVERDRDLLRGVDEELLEHLRRDAEVLAREDGAGAHGLLRLRRGGRDCVEQNVRVDEHLSVHACPRGTSRWSRPEPATPWRTCRAGGGASPGAPCATRARPGTRAPAR